MFKNTTPSTSVGLQFWVVYSQWHSKVLERLKPFNLTHTQFVILTTILWCRENSELVTQSSIATITGLDKMTVSKSIGQLVSTDVVTKQKNQHDTRSYALSLSDKGEKLAMKSLQLIEDLDADFFGVVGEKKKAIFQQLLLDYREIL